jgi:hypothetical protein
MTKKVGYGRPPHHTRWTKGQSGNPRGRPKGSGAAMQVLLAELNQTIQITENGRVKRVTKLEALFKSLTASSIKGNAKSASLILSWCARGLEGATGDDDPLTDDQRRIVEAYIERQVQLRLAQRKAEEEES